MTDEQEVAALWAELAERPDDTLKLALADRYAERNSPVLEHALRWCVARRHWPRVTPKGRYAVWGRRERRARHGHLDHELPAALCDAMGPGRDTVFRSVRLAVEHLAFHLDQLTTLCSLPRGG